VFAGAAFDVLDGLAARALGGGSELGKQLDSLADMVTFGVAPGMIVFVLPNWFSEGIQGGSIIESDAIDWPTRTTLASAYWSIPPLASAVPAMVIAIASAWRLARFNVDDNRTHGFLGLATPANALFWASVPFLLVSTIEGLGWDRSVLGIQVHLLANPIITGCMAIILGILMLSSLPLPSLKFQHYRWRGNEVIYLLLGIGAVLVVLYGMLAVPLILLLYLLSPLWGKLFPKTP